MAKKQMTNQIVNPPAEYKLVGEKKIDTIVYKTVYTKNNLDYCCVDYLKKLSQESTRENYKILFFNQIKSTPTSIQLKDISIIYNSSLIGGIEKYEGTFYKLIYENKQLNRTIKLYNN